MVYFTTSTFLKSGLEKWFEIFVLIINNHHNTSLRTYRVCTRKFTKMFLQHWQFHISQKDQELKQLIGLQKAM